MVLSENRPSGYSNLEASEETASRSTASFLVSLNINILFINP